MATLPPHCRERDTTLSEQGTDLSGPRPIRDNADDDSAGRIGS